MSLPLSIEFFPPRTDEAKTALEAVRQELMVINPEYISVTYGAGGSTQTATEETVKHIQKMGVDAAPHLTCVGSHKGHIRDLLQSYLDAGIHRLVALRGDMPSGMRELGEFHYAIELVEFVREEFGDAFHIEVAAYPEMHPQAKCLKSDLDHFAAKCKAGANGAITQYFYNADAYARFVELVAKRGVHIPIVPGIMPMTNFTQLARFSDASGAEIPRHIRKNLECYGDDLDAIREYGFDVVARLLQRLKEYGAPSFHFYTMNKSQPVLDLVKTL